MSNDTILESLSPAPSLHDAPAVDVATDAPAGGVLGILVGRDGAVPDPLGLDRGRLEAAGFDASVGSTLVVPTSAGSILIAVGVGDATKVEASTLRDAGAAFARAASSQAELGFSLRDIGSSSVEVGAAARAVTEGVLLARYRYESLRNESKATAVRRLTLVVDGPDQAEAIAGAERGRLLASATALARDLANTPHNHLTATNLADLAVELGGQRQLEVEVFTEVELRELGCGGLLGVNAGSAEPPRMVKLTYRPGGDGSGGGTLTLVGKGITYDSGGIALKPGDEIHAQMKNDMSGAGAILAAMSVLAPLDCPNTVIGYLMCTDNMPSATAQALGDVLTIRGGTTVEVVNTDAEGRLVMADALVLATEEHTDAIVDIATLTGACMRALGVQIAGVFGNHQPLVDQVAGAAGTTDEPVWQLPLAHRYAKEIDSPIADVRNLGTTPNGGALHAALFLEKFVGDRPWAHIDMAGTAQSSGDAGWKTAGGTGFGARLLAQLALDFVPPTTAPMTPA